MKIIKKTELADAVLKHFVSLLKAEKPFSASAEVVISPYVNGRENGWTVSVYDGTRATPAVTFSEDRRSDEIVVYGGNNYDYRLRGDDPRFRESHGISDAAWDGRKYFKNGESGKAACYALNQLLGSYGFFLAEDAKAETQAEQPLVTDGSLRF